MEKKIRHKKDFDELVEEDEKLYSEKKLHKKAEDFKDEIKLLNKLKGKIKRVEKFKKGQP